VGDDEAERRLYYVAMTRARSNLVLLQRGDRPHPFLDGLQGDFRRDRENCAQADVPAQVLGRRFELLAPDSLFVSYAGQQAASDPIHAALAEARPGDPLSLVALGPEVRIVDGRGQMLAKLSKAGCERWPRERLATIHGARLLCLVRRDREQEKSVYRERLQVERWHLPVVELSSSPRALPEAPSCDVWVK
jgi:ATP-dependent DNA helicase RecQ